MAPPTRSQFVNERKRRDMTLFQELKNTKPDTVEQVEEVITLLALAKTIRNEFSTHTQVIETPEWLDDKIRSLERELTLRTADVLEKRLREAKARRDSLKTAEEKRKELDAEIAALTDRRNAVKV